VGSASCNEEAERLSPDRHLIVDQDYDPDIEKWEFEPGTVVRCRKEKRGRHILVATKAARQTVAG
jgi:hypothetical protein